MKLNVIEGWTCSRGLILLAVFIALVGLVVGAEADLIYYGYTTVDPNVMPSISPNYLMGFSINVSEDLQLTDVGLIPSSSGSFDPTVKVGIYSDNGGAPGTKIAETAGQTVTRGVENLIPVTTPVDLSPGSYWYMANFDDPGALMSAPGDIRSTIHYAVLDYNDPLPTTYSSQGSWSGNVNTYYLAGIPEPGTATLLTVTGGLALYVVRRRLRCR